MDGCFNGKSYKNGWIGGKPTILGNIRIFKCLQRFFMFNQFRKVGTFDGNLGGGFKDFMAFLRRQFGKFWQGFFLHMGWNHQLDENEYWGNKDYESIQEQLYKVPSCCYLDCGGFCFCSAVLFAYSFAHLCPPLIGGLDVSTFHYPLNWKKSYQRGFRWMSPLWVMFETSPMMAFKNDG